MIISEGIDFTDQLFNTTDPRQTPANHPSVNSLVPVTKSTYILNYVIMVTVFIKSGCISEYLVVEI